MRVPSANVGVGHAWFAADPWLVQRNNRLLEFFAGHGIDRYPNSYTVDGRPLGTDRSAGLIAANGVAVLAATTPQRVEFVRRLWQMPVPAGEHRYYDGTLYLLAMLQASGNFRIYPPAGETVTAACP